MINKQKQKLKDYRKEYYKKYYAEKILNFSDGCLLDGFFLDGCS